MILAGSRLIVPCADVSSKYKVSLDEQPPVEQTTEDTSYGVGPSLVHYAAAASLAVSTSSSDGVVAPAFPRSIGAATCLGTDRAAVAMQANMNVVMAPAASEAVHVKEEEAEPVDLCELVWVPIGFSRLMKLATFLAVSVTSS